MQFKPVKWHKHSDRSINSKGWTVFYTQQKICLWLLL